MVNEYAVPHSPAWQRFNKAAGADKSVGIWHETYVVEAPEQGQMLTS